MPELIPTPKWVQDSYRPDLVKPHYKVEVTDDGFILHEIDLKSINPYTFGIREMEFHAKLTGKIVPVTGTLKDLYEWSRNHAGVPIGTPGTEFAKILADDNNYVVPMSFGMPSGSIMQACLAAHAYKDFLKIVEDFEKNPNDSITAFKFIDNHPMYWHFKTVQPLPPRRTRAKMLDGSFYEGTPNPAYAGPVDPATLPEPRIELATGNGWMRVEMQIIQGQFSFETSGTPYHVRTNYHDYALDVYSKSMDEGICELAAKIHANYDLDGNLRNGDDEPNGSH
jgi:hypothetical protein